MSDQRPCAIRVGESDGFLHFAVHPPLDGEQRDDLPLTFMSDGLKLPREILTQDDGPEDAHVTELMYSKSEVNRLDVDDISRIAFYLADIVSIDVVNGMHRDVVIDFVPYPVASGADLFPARRESIAR